MKQFWIGLICLGILVGCGTTNSLPPATLVIPTAVASATTAVLGPPATLAAVPTTAPVATAFATPEQYAYDIHTYRVAFVTADDVLNVRQFAGANNEIVATLAPTATNLTVIGFKQIVGNSTWFPLEVDGVKGWVNSRYLTTDLSAQDFCESPEVLAVIKQLETAVANRDNAQIAQLVQPERGLKIHYQWASPEVRLDRDEVANLFTSQTSFEWGTQDGSGAPITGSFSQAILPLLDRDLLPASETVCNEITYGPTTGLIQLPDGYQSVYYYTRFRPAGEIEFDWGSWVIGIEQWDGQYYLSYLIHFAYEI